MTLSARLALCLSLCEGARTVADIGCDHAYLAIALAQAGARVRASDLREGPLAIARRNVEAAGLSGRITLALGDGLQALAPGDCDTVAICGMGGESIAAILKAAPWTADGAHALVLQPQTRSDELRRFLAQNGYTVEREALAAEGRRLYIVLRARGGQPPMGQAHTYLCTERLLGDPLLPRYLAARRAQMRAIVRGKRRAGQDTAAEEAVLTRLEEMLHGA